MLAYICGKMMHGHQKQFFHTHGKYYNQDRDSLLKRNQEPHRAFYFKHAVHRNSEVPSKLFQIKLKKFDLIAKR